MADEWIGVLSISEMITDVTKPKYWDRNLFRCNLSNINPTWTELASNSSLCLEHLASKSFSFGQSSWNNCTSRNTKGILRNVIIILLYVANNWVLLYRGADKSLAWPGRKKKKLVFLSEWREFPSARCLGGKNLYTSSRLDVVEIARVPDMLPSLFPSSSG